MKNIANKKENSQRLAIQHCSLPRVPARKVHVYSTIFLVGAQERFRFIFMKKIKEVITIGSVETSEMMEKRHRDLLKDIRRYIGYFEDNGINVQTFFIPGKYKGLNGQMQPCYQITEKGCEFLAHKMTGEKGSVFTARYIERFHDMQSALEEATAAEHKAREEEIKYLRKQEKEMLQYLKDLLIAVIQEEKDIRLLKLIHAILVRIKAGNTKFEKRMELPDIFNN